MPYVSLLRRSSQTDTRRRGHIALTRATQLALIIGCASCDRTPVGKELDDKGAVIVTGDQPSQFREDYKRAAMLIGQGKVDEATRIYSNLAQKEPNSSDPYIGLAGCSLERGDYLEARRQYQTALENQPNSVNAFVGIGSSYNYEHNSTNAMNYFHKALGVNANNPGAHYGLAISYTQIGDHTHARQHLDTYEKLAPNSRYSAALEDYVERSIARRPIPPPTSN